MDRAAREDVFQVTCLLAECRQVILPEPLEWGEGLGDMGIDGDIEFGTFGDLAHEHVAHAPDQVGQTIQIVKGFGRQSHLKVQLDGLPSALEHALERGEDLPLAEVLADDFP